uniref:cysteine-rich and transmembrane domain-containing protein WIH1-like isoform X2 n=1 Tax=Erigeron canadensis TaxID=72917 RepID=UPI001CB95E0B|nr:cysteine-rich and transmembrane domain-containing protein WIH1-like isoform X2 [Erigeron canadensis]
MSSYEHNQQPQVPEGGGGAGKEYVTPTPLPPPPAAVGYPVKDGYEASDQNAPPHETQSRGDGFWRGCCAGLCCCCLLDICF